MIKYISVALLLMACLANGQSGSQAESIISKDGTSIYYEVHGEGPVIVLLHGLGSNRSSWAKSGFVDQLQNYRLILVDARGHGDSDGPGQPDGYAMKKFVEDLEAILLEESDSPPIFWGFSMGAAVGFHVLEHNPSLFSRYIIGDGMFGIYGNPPELRSAELGSAKVLRIQASRAFVGFKKSPNTMADFLEFDRTGENEDIRNSLGIIAAPTFIYRSGDTQRLVLQAQERTDFYIPPHFTNLDIHIFPQLTHGGLMGRSELIVPRVLEFLEANQN
ncbi:MAG: alpha/beta hydrolase [Gammaproteobacteria bacterium]|nr:alpha/beta hydrolase [Gammaproteobacteria bacterium]